MNSDLEYSNYRNRLLKFMIDELFGPESTDDQLRQSELLEVSPLQLYSTGVLFPQKSVINQLEDDSAEDEKNVPNADSSLDDRPLVEVKQGGKQTSDATSLEEQPLNLANEFSPSAVGITVKASLGFKILVDISAGKYKTEKVEKRHPKAGQEKADGSLFPDTREESNYRRIPIQDKVEIDLTGSLENRTFNHDVKNTDGMLKLNVRIRPEKGNIASISLALINQHKGGANSPPAFNAAFFQVELSVTEANGTSVFHPIDRAGGISEDEELAILDMLYREKRSFALGHGCGTGWITDPSDKTVAKQVWSDFLPSCDIKPVKPREKAFFANQFDLSMRSLSEVGSSDNDIIGNLSLLAKDYENWIIAKRDLQKNSLSDEYQITATGNLEKCWECLNRIEEGIEYLSSNSDAMLAFKLANRAMLIQQARTRFQKDIDPDETYIELSEDYRVTGQSDPIWRPFQLAFVLMNIACCSESDHPDREIVDLIWFPTGGGKTEAYLGLAAFCICLRRLSDSEDKGVAVLMRYTLRLLTAQQFQRAAALITALESLRLDKYLGAYLGDTPITIGLWVGMGLSPNRRKDAVKRLNELTATPSSQNPFQLLRCPWCRSSLDKSGWLGYKKEPRLANGEDTVIFRCSNRGCRWHSLSSQLPVVVIDDDIYDNPPTLLLGTVDKFAQLAWVPETGRIFGTNGFSDPPSLIIQDELHLISGPLGTIVGLYETVIDRLCSRDGKTPKIVASTATIRQSAKQCNGLYARDRFEFPPQGLDAGDSYFAYEDQEAAGRLYVGVFGTAVKSHATAQVRVISPLLQAVMPEPPEVQPPEIADKYATLLWYFNSLRELGHAVTMSTGDIPEHHFNLCARKNIEQKYRRRFPNVEELTSRKTAEEIPLILDCLNRKWPMTEKSRWPVDMLLATNMISVGVDVPRLGLMVVAGQPKSTAEYIQATSRVGRGFPGLVVTVYNPARSRDRSHYEQFVGYHQAIYRYVEPTSVTPFSAPARSRGFAGMTIALARLITGMRVPEDISKYPGVQDELMKVILDRIQKVDTDEYDDALRELTKIFKEWKEYLPQEFGQMAGTPTTQTLMYPLGRNVNEDFEGKAFPVLTSMRSVDVTCSARVLQTYPDLGE
ncbi:MAG: helicase-related protein [Idiomarina sp.]